MKKKKARVVTEAKTRTSATTVKITAVLDRTLWARLRSEAVLRGFSVRALLSEAIEELLKRWEKEEKR
jgi:hypothetical protein